MTRRPESQQSTAALAERPAIQPKPAASHPAGARLRAPIRVEVGSEIAGWRSGSRFDVALHGQVVSQVPPASLVIRDAAGNYMAAIQFDLDPDAAAEALPGGGTGFRTGFQIILPVPGTEDVRIADMWVRAEARDGAVFESAMRIACNTEKAEILVGPLRDPASAAMPAPRGILYLEAAEINAAGVLRAQGWTVAASPIVAVQFFASGERIGAGIHGRERLDVGEAYPGYPNARRAGFLLERQVHQTVRGASELTAQVLCLNGACLAVTVPLMHRESSEPEPLVAEAAPEPPTDAVAAPAEAAEPETVSTAEPETGSTAEPETASTAEPETGTTAEPEAASTAEPASVVAEAAPRFLLVCDQAAVVSPDVLRVTGWTASEPGIERVTIEVDGHVEGDAEYGRERWDVASEYATLPLTCGFTFDKLIPGLSGRPRQVRIVAINRDGEQQELTAPVVDPTPPFLFELDIPATRDGVAIEPIAGRMTIEGWALARDGMAGIEIALDDVPLGSAHFGVVRPDVGREFPTWIGAARSGYTFHCPSRALPDGNHVIRLTARSKTGDTYSRSFRITVRKSDDPEETASIRRKVSRVERDTMFAVLNELDWRPAFHLIVTGDAAAGDKARWLTIRSILDQSWSEWRATILAASKREARATRALLKTLPADEAGRFRVIDATAAAAWQAPLAAGGEALIGVLAIGDELGRDALGAFAIASGLHREADCLYADEFRLAPGNPRPEAFFKPDFSPTLLMAMNYIGRPLVVRPAVLAATGATAATLTRDGCYDLALRCVEAATSVHHLTELLSRTDGGQAANQDNAAVALRNALARRGIDAEPVPGLAPGTWRANPTAPVTGKVSIIIPTRAADGHIEACLNTVREVTGYRDFELICIDNIPESEATWKSFVRERADKIVEMPPPFNWSRFNNRAADAANGEFLLFLNDDIEVIEPGWLEAMLREAANPEVGIVGARLLYPNRTVQHAGMFLGADGAKDIGRHAFRYTNETEPGYFGLALTKREVIAVTGACLLVRRAVFDQLGGFDEAHDVVNNDLDFCLRAHHAGLRTIYTPDATLIHHELASREHLPDNFDTASFAATWGTLFAAGDPYFNPHLSRHSDHYQVEDEDIRAVFSGHPLIHRDEVKRMLVIKLDHIGDFVTSLPAIRRLKAAFPAARLSVLAAPASTAFAAVEPAIDEVIPFEFFHARSELGEKELSQDDLDALTQRLAPYRFDIAVDLRKHLSTRHILRCSGARLLAGYDSLDQFPWLDIALEWEGDKALQHKRNHITDDLLNLVAAVDDACEPARRLFDPTPSPMPIDELPEPARRLFDRPVVAVHPGAGNITKQWPEAHVAALIELLIERDGVSVLLVGGGDDVTIADSILRRSAHPDRLASVAGAVALRDLPRLLAACALYIGTDSGPKHIAAAAGVPTIGVHSGVVDPGEWAPLGERSVALYRNMSCAPCYLSKAEDCPRDLACIQLLEPALVHAMAQRFLARPISAASRTASSEPGKPAWMRYALGRVAGSR